MDTVRIYFKVKDFPKWKKLFDEDIRNGLLANQGGVTKFDLQKIPDTGELSLYFELKSAKQFKEFLDSDHSKQRVSEGGVEGLRAEYMERLEEKKLPVGEKAA